MTCCDKLTGQNARPTLNSLPAVIGELHFFFIELDAVTEDAENGTRSHDIGIEALLLQSVVLGKACLINEIHGLLHCIFDIFVVRSQCEEEMMEHFYMALSFHIEGFLHRTALYQNRYITVEDVNLLLCIRDHDTGCPDAGDTDNDAAYKEQATDDHHQLDLIFEILYYHITVLLYYRIIVFLFLLQFEEFRIIPF